MIRRLCAALNIMDPQSDLLLKADGRLQVVFKEDATLTIPSDNVQGWTDKMIGKPINWIERDNRLKAFASIGFEFEHVTHTKYCCFMWAKMPGDDWRFHRVNLPLPVEHDWIGRLLDMAGIVPLPPITLEVHEASSVLRALKDRYTDSHPLVMKFQKYLNSPRQA